jgi:hypothetical protein
METDLQSLTYESCLVSQDDVIVIGRTFKGHLLYLRKVFQRFQEARRNFNLVKCEIW